MEKKRILFIGVGFHEYDDYIISHLEKQHDVWYVNSIKFRQDHPYFMMIAKRFLPSQLMERIDNNTSKFIEKTKHFNFDIVFVITGANLTDKHIEDLKRYHKNARFVLYLWDSWNRSVINRDFLSKNFTNIYSFDPLDCEKYGFKHRPLFYIDKNSDITKDIDVCFVGGQHTRRLENIAKIRDMCKKHGLSWNFVVVMRISAYIKMTIKSYKLMKEVRDMISYKYVSYNEYLKILRRSKVVIDIHNTMQTGLTMRTIEALSVGTKIVTTNENIQRYANIPKFMYYVWNMEIEDSLFSFINTPVDADYKIDPFFSIDYFLGEVLS